MNLMNQDKPNNKALVLSSSSCFILTHPCKK